MAVIVDAAGAGSFKFASVNALAVPGGPALGVADAIVWR
jgi:hypothetical protein